MATPDVDTLFAACERSLRELRRIAAGDLAKRRGFKDFIGMRNSFLETLSNLNELLYREQDALLVPQLLDPDDDEAEDAPDIARLRVVLADIRLPEGEHIIDAVVAALETREDRFAVVSVYVE
jgi:hypothetical protein